MSIKIKTPNGIDIEVETPADAIGILMALENATDPDDVAYRELLRRDPALPFAPVYIPYPSPWWHPWPPNITISQGSGTTSGRIEVTA